MEASKEASLQVIRRVVEPDAPATPIQHFLYTMVGADILLEAGYFDQVKLREALETSRESGGKTVSVDLHIKHRLLFNPNVIIQLAEATGQIIRTLVQSGIIVDKSVESINHAYTANIQSTDDDSNR